MSEKTLSLRKPGSPNVTALPAGRVAQLQARRVEVGGQLENVRRTRQALRLRRGEAVLAGGTDRKAIEAELTALADEELALLDALSALDAQERRALANQSRAEVEAYNAVVRAKAARLDELTSRWRAICQEAGPIAAEVLERVDELRGHAARCFGTGETGAIDRIPKAMLTELAVALCPPDNPTGARPYREVLSELPAVASHSVAQEFLRSGTPSHQLNEIRRVLIRELPADEPSPEAA